MYELTTTTTRALILQAIANRADALLVLLPSDSSTEADLLWARSSLDPSELPAAVVNPQPETCDRDTYGIDRVNLPVTVSLCCLLGSHNSVDLGEMLLGQMCAQIPMNGITVDSKLLDIRYTGGGVESYPERDDQALVVSATFEIEYELTSNIS